MQFLAQITTHTVFGASTTRSLKLVWKFHMLFSHTTVVPKLCPSVTGLTRQHPRPPYRLLPSVQAEVQEDRLVPIKLPAAREQPLSSPHNYSAGPVKKPETLSLLHYSHTAKDTA